uniref:Uncharacterized protein n=1 Tax=Spironucleus salmonicida TaxID=348837 RepID=V6LG21_9EUKA|eukprot:EST43218.1 Hypothetical protein SS50377_17082 [Spironucleus salmonicida]
MYCCQKFTMANSYVGHHASKQFENTHLKNTSAAAQDYCFVPDHRYSSIMLQSHSKGIRLTTFPIPASTPIMPKQFSGIPAVNLSASIRTAALPRDSNGCWHLEVLGQGFK